MIPSKPPTISYQTWYCYASPWARVHAERLVCYFQGQGHSKGSCDQHMAVSAVSSKLLISWFYDTPSKARVPVEKNFGYSIQGQDHSKWSICQCFSRWFVRWCFEPSQPQRITSGLFFQMISSKPPNMLLLNLVLWCSIISRSVMQKDWFAIFKVKVTARAHMIKIWRFPLYLLNCWSFCYQTWFDSTLS